MYKKLFFLSIGVLICSCIHKEQDPLKQEVRMGIAKITGEIINYPEPWSRDSTVHIYNGNWDSTLFIYNVPYPVTNERKTYRTQLQKDGSFSFEIPLECNIATGISFGNYFIMSYLVPNIELDIRIEFSGEQMNVKTNNPALTIPDDYKRIKSITDFLDTGTRKSLTNKQLEKRSLNDYTQFYIECLNNLKKQVDTISGMSSKLKTMIFNDYKIKDLSFLFTDDPLTARRYGNDTIPPQLDISYYKFLKSYDLNDPDCLYALYYSDVLQEILSNEVFAIPPIEDRAIEEWLATVRKTMADLTGSEKGLFYDMLAANAYARQFNERLQPLSEKQRQHIQAFFSNRSFSEILLKKNEEIEKMTGIAAHLKINETATLPDGRPVETYSRENKNLPDGKLIDSIVSKYKGKIVVVDFWATWCAPCMAAMSESRELKAELLDKEVVFVYITSRSSPMELWKRKIPGIGGEHYYLNRDGEWESISYSEKYGFGGIPTYLIFDAEGNLKSKLTGYPGNDKFKRLIDELL
jgi:thiol-disulfide isomerase/thioredoxin